LGQGVTFNDSLPFLFFVRRSGENLAHLERKSVVLPDIVTYMQKQNPWAFLGHNTWFVAGLTLHLAKDGISAIHE
jgi:hypothetical protein